MGWGWGRRCGDGSRGGGWVEWCEYGSSHPTPPPPGLLSVAHGGRRSPLPVRRRTHPRRRPSPAADDPHPPPGQHLSNSHSDIDTDSDSDSDSNNYPSQPHFNPEPATNVQVDLRLGLQRVQRLTTTRTTQMQPRTAVSAAPCSICSIKSPNSVLSGGATDELDTHSIVPATAAAIAAGHSSLPSLPPLHRPPGEATHHRDPSPSAGMSATGV